MAITIQTSPDAESRLAQAAAREGVSVEEYTLRAVLQKADTIIDKRPEETSMPPSLMLRRMTDEERQQARKTLQSFDEDDPNERRETRDYLERVLDEDRLSNRPFFQTDSKEPS